MSCRNLKAGELSVLHQRSTGLQMPLWVLVCLQEREGELDDIVSVSKNGDVVARTFKLPGGR